MLAERLLKQDLTTAETVRRETEPEATPHERVGERSVPAAVPGLLWGSQRGALVGSAADPAEADADAAATRVVAALRGMGGAGGQGLDAGGRSAPLESLRRSPAGAGGGAVEVGAAGGQLSDETTDRLAAVRGGTALPEGLRRSMSGPLGGADLSNVHLHTGAEAASLNRAMSAQAFTRGTDVFFRDGMPDVSTDHGLHLLAHEVAHTVQNGSPVRRLMSSAELRKEHGNAGLLSNRFKAVQSILSRWEKFAARPMMKTEEPKAVVDVAESGAVLLEAVVTTCRGFLDGKEGQQDKRMAAVARIKDEALASISLLRRSAPIVVSRMAAGQRLRVDATWADLARLGAPDVLSTRARSLDDEGGQISGSSLGGINEAHKVKLPGEEVGFFKAAKDSIEYQHVDHEILMETPEWTRAKKMGIPRGATAAAAANATKHKKNKYQRVVANAEDASGPRFQKRAVATTRLDDLLGAGVTARTEEAVLNIGGQVVKGQFMQKADGVELNTRLHDKTKLPLDLGDPTLQRMLSKLEILDALCGQTDRHLNNIFIDTDDKGATKSLTGIDHDLSFGVEKNATDSFDMDDNHEHWFGLGIHIDHEVATTVLKLKPADIYAALDDVLLPVEVDATVQRLIKLQAALKKAKTEGRLVKKGGWGEKTRDKRTVGKQKETGTHYAVGYNNLLNKGEA